MIAPVVTAGKVKVVRINTFRCLDAEGRFMKDGDLGMAGSPYDTPTSDRRMTIYQHPCPIWKGDYNH